MHHLLSVVVVVVVVAALRGFFETLGRAASLVSHGQLLRSWEKFSAELDPMTWKSS